MKILAIAGGGGRGKTQTTEKLALSLTQRHQRRVLIIDLDPLVGSNISSHFLSRDQILFEAATIGEALAGSHVNPYSPNPLLSLFVGKEALLQATNYDIKTFLQNWSLSREYDYCLIDCNAKLDALTEHALVAADRVLVSKWVHWSEGKTAEINEARTIDTVRRLREEQHLPAKEICFSISTPLDELSDGDWEAITMRTITLLDA